MLGMTTGGLWLYVSCADQSGRHLRNANLMSSLCHPTNGLVPRCLESCHSMRFIQQIAGCIHAKASFVFLFFLLWQLW